MTDDNRVNHYDRLFGSLDGLPNGLQTKPQTVRTILLVSSVTFTAQTFRQPDAGDYLFLEQVDANGVVRLVIPPAVCDLIARQREALTEKSRKRAARKAAETRRERGIVPAFLNTKKIMEAKALLVPAALEKTAEAILAKKPRRRRARRKAAKR